MLPIIQALATQGLNLLANAVMAKGQEVVEEKLGIKLEGAKSEDLRRAELQHEEWLIEAGIRQKAQEIEAEKVAQVNVTERWKADMISDSWLSKNIRPLVLCYLLGAYTLFSVGSGIGFSITQSYVELLAQMLMLVMSAYFAGRTIEKIVDMRERGK